MLALGDSGRVSSFGISMSIMLELLSLERMVVGSCASSGKKCGIVVATRDIEL